MIPAELIVPLVALVLAVIYTLNTLDLPGSAVLYPRLVSLLVMGLSLFQIIRWAAGRRRGTGEEEAGPGQGQARIYLLMGLALVFALVVEHTGFIPAVFGFILAGALVFRLKPLSSMALAGAVTLVSYLIFVKLLMLPL